MKNRVAGDEGMHYRKLVIDGVEHKYNIGKKFVKIDNSTIAKEDIGIKFGEKIIVTPGMIASYLKGEDRTPEKYFTKCRCKDVDKSLGYIPFDLEIYGERNIVYWCDKCFLTNEMAI